MKEIKVGEYIRDRGEILKIEIFEKLPYYNNERVLIKFKEYAGSNTYSLKEIEEWKHSPNIIDLIEVGDYVNGYKIIIDEGMLLPDCKHAFTVFERNGTSFMKIWGEKDIKSIVTQEQFNSIKYVIGE